MVTRSIYSFAELSLSPVFRRKWQACIWSSRWLSPESAEVNETLSGRNPNPKTTNHRRRSAPQRLRRAYPLAENWSTNLKRSNLWTWGKSDLRETDYSGVMVIVHWLGFRKTRAVGHYRDWHERITSFETPITKAAFQLKQVCQHLPERPISLWDSE